MRALDPVFDDDAVLGRLVAKRKKARLGRDSYFNIVSNVLDSPAYAHRQGVGGLGGGLNEMGQPPLPKIEERDPPKGTEDRHPREGSKMADFTAARRAEFTGEARGGSDGQKEEAAVALRNLANNADNKVAIKKAGWRF